VAVGLIVSSLIAYMPFLFGREEMPPLYAAIIQLGLLVAVGLDLLEQKMGSISKTTKNVV
jgi:hypothetical protein